MNDLHGATILVTRPQPKADEMANLIREMNGEPIIFPTIAIEPPESWQAVDAAIQILSDYDWIVFSSVNGVKYFTARIREISELSKLQALNIVAVGSKTASALEERKIRVDIIPEHFSADGIIDYFSDKDIGGKRFMHITGNKGRTTLQNGLGSLGADVSRLETYRNVSPDSEAVSEIIPRLRNGSVDYLTFTSPSTFDNFYEMLSELIDSPEELINQSTIAVIGPVTAKAIESAGFSVAVVPEEYTIEQMLQSIAEYKNFIAETAEKNMLNSEKH